MLAHVPLHSSAYSRCSSVRRRAPRVPHLRVASTWTMVTPCVVANRSIAATSASQHRLNKSPCQSCTLLCRSPFNMRRTMVLRPFTRSTAVASISRLNPTVHRCRHCCRSRLIAAVRCGGPHCASISICSSWARFASRTRCSPSSTFTPLSVVATRAHCRASITVTTPERRFGVAVAAVFGLGVGATLDDACGGTYSPIVKCPRYTPLRARSILIIPGHSLGSALSCCTATSPARCIWMNLPGIVDSFPSHACVNIGPLMSIVICTLCVPVPDFSSGSPVPLCRHRVVCLCSIRSSLCNAPMGVPASGSVSRLNCVSNLQFCVHPSACSPCASAARWRLSAQFHTVRASVNHCSNIAAWACVGASTTL